MSRTWTRSACPVPTPCVNDLVAPRPCGNDQEPGPARRGPAHYPALTRGPCASRCQTPPGWSLKSVGEDVDSKMHSMLPSRLFDSPGSEERPRVAAAGRTRYPLKALSQFSEEETEGLWLTQSQFSKDTGEEDATSWKLRVRRRAFSASWGRAREEHCRSTKLDASRRAGGGKALTCPCQACASIIDEAALVCEVSDAHSVLLCPSHWLSIADTLQRTNTAALVSPDKAGSNRRAGPRSIRQAKGRHVSWIASNPWREDMAECADACRTRRSAGKSSRAFCRCLRASCPSFPTAARTFGSGPHLGQGPWGSLSCTYFSEQARLPRRI